MAVSAASSVRPAARALDGNEEPTFAGQSVGEALPAFSSTANATISWIDVDLGNQRQIQSVELVNTTDSCATSGGGCDLNDISVIVSPIPIVDTDAKSPRSIASKFPLNSREKLKVGGHNSNNRRVIQFNRYGRWVRVQSNNGKAINLAELKVYEADNLAWKRSIRSSSTDGLNTAARAVDANLDQTLANGSVAQTTAELNAHIEVDLGASLPIRQIDLFPRSDSNYLLPETFIFLSDDPMANVSAAELQTKPGVRFFKLWGGQARYAVENVNWPTNRARFVRVQINTPSPAVLAISELQVWGVGQVGLYMDAKQSSTTNNGGADRALDGNTDGTFANGSVTHTDLQSPTWTVDLKALRTVETVNLWNRTDCCAGRLSAVTVQLFTSDPDSEFSVPVRSYTMAASDPAPRLQSIPFASVDDAGQARGIPARYIKIFNNKSDFLSLAEVEVVARDGVVTTVTNGKTTSGATVGQKFTYQGFVPEPGVKVEIEALKTPTSDQVKQDSWRIIATTTAESTERVASFAAGPMYLFRVTSDQVSGFAAGEWVDGGLGRVRASFVDRHGARVFMRSLNEDASPNYNWPIQTYVSTQKAPASNILDPPPLLQYEKFKKVAATDTDDYYISTGISNRWTNLAAFRREFFDGMPLYNPGNHTFVNGVEIVARYYNRGDLGIGREMHCIRNGTKTACYVSNFAPLDGAGQAIFGDKDAAIAALPNHNEAFATVAMVHDSAIADGELNKVLFAVFGKPQDGEPLATVAGLDNLPENIRNDAIPNNCMVCHGSGGELVRSGLRVQGTKRAFFLPFDLDSFDFPASGDYTQSAQAAQLFALNAVIRNATTAQGRQLITGWHNGTIPFNGRWVPPGWNTTPRTANLYLKVVRPYCRTCHVSDTNGPLAFSTFSEFKLFFADMKNKLCGPKPLMPQAQQTALLFWNSSARAHLMGFMGLNDDCKGL